MNFLLDHELLQLQILLAHDEMGTNFDSHLFRLFIFIIRTAIYSCLILNLMFFLNSSRILIIFGSFHLFYDEERGLPVIILIGNDRRDEGGSFVVILEVPPSF